MGGADSELQTNAEYLEAIKEVVVGGVSSSMRAAAVPQPLVVRRADGCLIRDVEDGEYIDFNMGYGPHIFGYADRDLAEAVADQFTKGHMTGLPHELDAEAGALVAELVPGVEQIKFANSGTEAVTSVLRLARATTGRQLVVTFEGHYHGWSETVLRAGKTTLQVQGTRPTDVVPGAPGMIPEALGHTAQVPWNDPEAVKELFARDGDRIAAVILEPVLANAGVIPPAPGFLQLLRDLTSRSGSMLIFDEVITGFRVARGGAQERYGVEPDLTVLSKVMGGGFPVAAFGGRKAAMRLFASNEAHHAGVYAGNHGSLRAVVTMLTKIRAQRGLYEELEGVGAAAEDTLREVFAAEGRSVHINRVGTLMCVALLRKPLEKSDTLRGLAEAFDFSQHRRFQILAQREGVYFHPNPLEPWFLSTAHTRSVLDKAAGALRRALVVLG
ncbi:aspartate aminotransferase family protein [Streptomyces nitrosporeus]|uniref:Aspartate aminotransferase family protein n=1 Tax=Streptomyces nitrosporeus TaxID=28894 RepID=A0A5J6FCZ6_9ACTN|nr:aspartate aminotransferase family protein [Streptomyces nitrosporeus]QEU72730.1 aspartate aminotransferase family protein [Streptomyces nitrosporeus]GGY75565.1 glutamate-1-semialdehyde 2,1-aminomutase [Streptomyces nitrosporeus]